MVFLLSHCTADLVQCCPKLIFWNCSGKVQLGGSWRWDSCCKSKKKQDDLTTGVNQYTWRSIGYTTMCQEYLQLCVHAYFLTIERDVTVFKAALFQLGVFSALECHNWYCSVNTRMFFTNQLIKVGAFTHNRARVCLFSAKNMSAILCFYFNMARKFLLWRKTGRIWECVPPSYKYLFFSFVRWQTWALTLP